MRISGRYAALAILGTAFELSSFGASIGPVTITPDATPVGVAASILIAAQITDSSIIPTSINVQEIDLQGRVVSVAGTMADDGKNGDAVANDQVFTLSLQVYREKPGPLTYRVSAGALGSLTRVFSAPVTFNVTGQFATGITIAQPANLAFTNTSPIVVSGSAGDPNAAVQINGIQASQGGNVFQASIPLQEGNNTITAVASNSTGATSTSSIQVTLDTAPPHLSIDSPADGSHTTESTATVTGIVNDIVVGTVNAQQATVTVNGSIAQIANRTYTATGIPLQIGLNTIQVVGRDQTGNSATLSAQVTRDAITQPYVKLVSGNNQAGSVGTQLTQPFIVQALNGTTPVPNVPVIYKIVENDGFLQPGTGKPVLVSVNTDSQGKAQVFLTLGNRAGAGNNTVQAYAGSYQGIATFTASGNPKEAAKINVDSGNNQFGAVNQTLALPFVAVVTDAGHNRLAGVPVTFTVKQGGGTFGGQANSQTTTDGDGRALAVLALGSQPGQDNNLVDATFAGNPGFAASFTASAKVPGNPAATTISGVVLDNSNNPIPGVTMRVFQTNQGSNNNQPMQVGTPALTNNAGVFRIVSAPVGFFKLMADGTTTNIVGKSYPTLEYDLVTVAGQDNGVGMPIYLPALDPLAKVCVDSATGGELKISSSPGFSLKILPGSATFPGGSKTGCVSVTPVNPDKVPMVPGFGQQPRYVVTIQPVGTTFNPPAAIAIPNVDGLAPNAKTEMYSYDHDLASFVAIGSGTVSTDGSVIASDPGVGVLKAGWHCGGNPNVPGSGEPVHVRITTTAPVVVAKDGTTTVAAQGGPLENPAGTYSWKSSDTSVVAIQGSASSATITVKGAGPRKATLTVRFTCSSVDQNGVHPYAEATADVYVIKVLDVTSQNAEQIAGVGNTDILHFVTPKGSGNAVLTAAIDPDDRTTRSFITWEGATQDSIDPLSATVPRGTASKNIVKIKINGKTAKEARVWVVWTAISSSDRPITYSSGAFPTIGGGYNFTHTISPATMFTDGDRPDLKGANATPPPGGSHWTGDPLSAGADQKWDNSRQIRSKKLNPAGISDAALGGPPLPDALSYPTDPVEGNDDRSTVDETNDPYGNPATLSGTDFPQAPISNAAGSNGDTFEWRFHFHEFTRLELAGTWYRVSDDYLWRIHIKFKKVSGVWVNDTTTKALDNSGF